MPVATSGPLPARLKSDLRGNALAKAGSLTTPISVGQILARLHGDA
jgi:hypothetical protein